MIEKLIREALEARKHAYAPYSHYLVGAALLTGDGRIFSGCNVENASYGATICAERTAVFKAVSEGMKRIDTIVIAGGREGEEITSYAYPCGICRQVISEFADENTKVVIAKTEKDYEVYDFAEILPLSFDRHNL